MHAFCPAGDVDWGVHEIERALQAFLTAMTNPRGVANWTWMIERTCGVISAAAAPWSAGAHEQIDWYRSADRNGFRLRRVTELH